MSYGKPCRGTTPKTSQVPDDGRGTGMQSLPCHLIGVQGRKFPGHPASVIWFFSHLLPIFPLVAPCCVPFFFMSSHVSISRLYRTVSQHGTPPVGPASKPFSFPALRARCLNISHKVQNSDSLTAGGSAKIVVKLTREAMEVETGAQWAPYHRCASDVSSKIGRPWVNDRTTERQGVVRDGKCIELSCT